MTTWDEMPEGTEDFNEALLADLKRMGVWPDEPSVAENPVFIQSRADGTVYEYKFTESAGGKYVYATEDGSATRILDAADIAEGFHDVTEMETKLRAALAARGVTPEVRHELAAAGFEVADCAPDGTIVPTMGPCAPRGDWRGHPVERRKGPR